MTSSGKNGHGPAPGSAHDPARTQARDWLVKLASGSLPQHERDELHAWLDADPSHRAAFDKEQSVWQKAGHLKDVFGPFTWAAPPTARRSTDGRTPGASRRDHANRGTGRKDSVRRQPPSGRRRIGYVTGAAIAACIALVLLGGEIRLWLAADYRTASGEQLKVTLPDGSTAHLNTDSAIDVDYRGDERRIILLRGETYFSVVKDASRPFTVWAQDRSIRAVGTAFAVRDDGSQVAVTVTSGVIEVAPLQTSDEMEKRSRAVALTVDQQVVYRDGGGVASVRNVDAKTLLSWREGKIVFDGIPFSKAVAEFDRYLPGRIFIAPGTEVSAPVSGVFSRDRLRAALIALAATRELRVRELTPYLVILY